MLLTHGLLIPEEVAFEIENRFCRVGLRSDYARNESCSKEILHLLL